VTGFKLGNNGIYIGNSEKIGLLGSAQPEHLTA
jgi:hypothetical protein